MSMVSNTTESTAQSTPSLLGHQINIRSSMSSGSNRSERRRRRSRSNASVASDSSNSSRSPVSKTSSRKSSFSRKSRLSRASSRYDDESFESGVEENRSPIFQLPSPPVDEISVCASSLSCRSGRSARQPSESGASTTSCRSGRSLQKKQASQRSSSEDKKDSSWTRMKSRFKNISKHL